MRSKEELKGVVDRVVFRNETTGFTVLELNSDVGRITVVGISPEINEGEYLTVYGEYVHHREYGNQFKGEFFERLLPDSAVAITKYLSGGAVRGIGPKTAVKLVERFGDDTLNVMANDPERISEVRGISKKSAVEISKKINEIIAVKSTMEELGNIELSSLESIKLFDRYGAGVVELIYDNPYILCGYPLYKNFDFADRIALNAMWFSPNDKKRVAAAIVYILRHNNLSNGHTCLPLDRLVTTTAGFLSLPEEEIYGNINSIYEDESIYLDNIEEEAYVFLPESITSEQYISDRLNLLNSLEYKTSSDMDLRIHALEEREGIVYEELQKNAIRSSLKYGAVVINGGPGTGKTTTLKAVLEICEEQGDRVVLAAPTGRASKRITEVTGRDAYTIHRLLEVDFGNDIEKFRFLRNEK
ncbi:MAG: Flp pilus assembly complex ATPase component TadA, partial [Ruminococcaceae bacterium]|nr:Flp pilus assembly complex ATPase component TadA [Oscillospiraceae bacterium]